MNATNPKMMPGQVPYTSEELKKLYRLIHDAATYDPGEDCEDEAIRAFRDRPPLPKYRRRFYLCTSHSITRTIPALEWQQAPGWLVEGILEKTGSEDYKVVSTIRVSIVGASREDALWKLNLRLRDAEVGPEDVFTI